MKHLRSWLILALLLLPLTVFAQATETKLENPLLGIGTAQDLLARLAGGLAFITGTLALLFTIIGGYIILTAGGNSERFAQGKRTVTFAIIGLLVAVASYQILITTINILTGAATGAGQLPEFAKESKLVDPLGLTTLPDGDMPAFVFYGKRVIGYLVNLLGVATVFMYVYGGLVWMLSGGSPEKITQAKKALGYATIGAVIVLSSYLLIRFVYNPWIGLLMIK